MVRAVSGLVASPVARSGMAAVLLAAASVVAVAAPTPVTVPGSAIALVDLGSFAAGTYNLVATGVIDLTPNGIFPLRPDGVPNVPITLPGYLYFNPGGSLTADGDYGPAGANANFGALIGTLNPAASLAANPAPSQAADWFQIGYARTVTLATAGHIYAAINDTNPSNNAGAFQVAVSAVPEPAHWAMTLAGLAVLGVWRRRQQSA